MIETLVQFFLKPFHETKGKTPDGLCPNCWGEQEYDNKIRELYMEKQIDVNNHVANYAFIQDFIVNQIDGIKLKKRNSYMYCSRCNKTYKI